MLLKFVQSLLRLLQLVALRLQLALQLLLLAGFGVEAVLEVALGKLDGQLRVDIIEINITYFLDYLSCDKSNKA